MATGSLNLPYLLLTGSVVVAAVFAFAVLQPALTSVQAVQADIAATTAQRAEREEFLRTLDSKLADLEVNREHELRLQTVLPADEQMEDALRILDRAAAASGLTLVSVTNTSHAVQSQARTQQARGGVVALPGTVAPLGVNVDLDGSYQGFRAFVAALERSPRLMDIDVITLQRNELELDRLSISLSIQFYMLSNEPL